MRFCGIVAIVCAAALSAQGADRKNAPVSEKVIAAKTIYFEDKSGDRKLVEAVLWQLKDWGRWKIVTERPEADLVVSLDHRGRLKNNFYLTLIDRESGETLWTVKKDIAIGTWSGAAQALVKELRKPLDK